LNVLLCPVSNGDESSVIVERAIHQRWHDEIAVLSTILSNLEQLPLLLEDGQMEIWRWLVSIGKQLVSAVLLNPVVLSGFGVKIIFFP
jgi:hypothetical protein